VAYSGGRGEDDSLSSRERLDQVNRWSLSIMTRLNRDILEGRVPHGDFGSEFEVSVLARLPAPESFSPSQARQLVVLLGLAGASVARHYQEAGQAHRATPELAFDGLTAGSARESFGRYFARLAERTGTGHGRRDSYASLVRWNLPAAEVWWGGELLAELPTAFDDGLVRSYTGVADEHRFFGLLKASEVLERAVNLQLMPLSDGSIDLRADEALARIGRAVVLLDALRELNHDFAVRPEDQGLGVAHFMDVFRQYAVHWEAGDIPPSGALDPEALIRDLLVGIALPSYPDHLRRMFAGLLDGERATLTRLLERVSLPVSALRLAGLDPVDLAAGTPAELDRLVAEVPVLAGLHLLLNAHARVSGVHLRLSKRFLFAPQRARDQAGLGDPGVVSNRTGTTGMDESRLEMLTRARRHHALSPLHVVATRDLERLAGLDRPRPAADPAVVRGAGPPQVLVRFTGSKLPSYDLGLPDRDDRRDPIFRGGRGQIEHAEPGAA
jgi:hypothetical protein